MRRHLGEFEHVLLYALAQAGHDASSNAIRDVIEQRTGRVVSPGAIYTAFDRLQRRGFVTSQLGDPTPQRGGKRKRLYRITKAGATTLEHAHAALEEMARGLKSTLRTSR